MHLFASREHSGHAANLVKVVRTAVPIQVRQLEECPRSAVARVAAAINVKFRRVEEFADEGIFRPPHFDEDDLLDNHLEDLFRHRRESRLAFRPLLELKFSLHPPCLDEVDRSQHRYDAFPGVRGDAEASGLDEETIEDARGRLHGCEGVGRL
jgi:hypothetical protein